MVLIMRDPFAALLAVQRAMENAAAYLKCGPSSTDSYAVRCADCHAEKLVAFSCKRRGFCLSCGEAENVTAASPRACVRRGARARLVGQRPVPARR